VVWSHVAKAKALLGNKWRHTVAALCGCDQFQ